MEIFEYLKNKDYDNLINFIKKNSSIDLNIRDNNDNFFIEYVIETNNIKLIEFVLDQEIYIDIIDNNGTTILYNLIKFNNIDVIKIILKKNKNIIGISIVDKKDLLGRICLHYCIIFNNLEILKLLLNENADPYLVNNNGDNVFFFSIKYNRIEIFNELFKKYNNFNITNKHNQTILQFSIKYGNYKLINYLIDKNVINLNNIEKEYGTTILHQLVINNRNNLIEKVVDNGADITISDYMGNNVIHYSIIENNDAMTLYFLKFNKINLDFSDIDGNTVLHLFLKNSDIYNNDILYILIEKTNLNIQDNNGDTCLHLLVMKNLIEKYKDLLEKKELNIFIKNNNGESCYDIFSKDSKIENLLELVSLSYYNNLNKTSLLEWEQKCSLIKSGEKIKYILKNRKDCLDKIKKVIKTENRSIPKFENIKYNFKSGTVLKDCFFTGFPIDILFGILFLKKEFTKINLILDYPLCCNNKLMEYYSTIGVDFNYKLDFVNTMIMWSYQKIFIPEYFDSVIKKTLKKSKIIVIPIGIETSRGAHANILFWDVKKNKLERFEPHGKNTPIDLNYNPTLLDSLIYQNFKIYNKDIEYITPDKYLPSIGFQIIESQEDKKCKKIGDPNGYCVSWCIWYCYNKILNLDISSDELVTQLINNIKLQNINFKDIIRDFSKNISNLRDTYLEKVNLTIHDWVNSRYTEDDLNKLEKLIFTNFN